jgi:anaphase-promoting complex subunit 4
MVRLRKVVRWRWRGFVGSLTVSQLYISSGSCAKICTGHLLAIAWSDGSVRLVGADSTKIVHQFSTGDKVTGITCMGWTSNFTRRKRNEVDSKKGPGSWGDVLDEGSISEDKAPLDLPRDLALIDIETSLPKLSVLAGGGTS